MAPTALSGPKTSVMTNQRLLHLLAGAIAALGLLLGACGNDDDDETAATPAAVATPTGAEATVAVSIREWAVSAEPATTSSARVTFTVRNDGGSPHEFVVIRTDLGVDELPLLGVGVDETQLEVLARTESFFANEERTLALDLFPGNYVLICNIPGHYEAGMRTSFVVE